MKHKNKNTFKKMIKAGELFKKSLGLLDEDIYKLLKK